MSESQINLKKLLHEAYKNVPHAADGSASNADLENYMVEHLAPYFPDSREDLSESARRSLVKAFMRDYIAESYRAASGIYPTFTLWCESGIYPTFTLWCEEQTAKGRAESELTFGNFAEEWAIPVMTIKNP